MNEGTANIIIKDGSEIKLDFTFFKFSKASINLIKNESKSVEF